ncbi:pyruvate formate-lyase-activating protein [Clostridium aestuarii]|uniref:Pyruvate formate-lyase-activating enzyme n=1 Tax=Clostridium aestuarii TaxID=338193 RepID=A0ABT4CVU4_9CLOT|nr:pyruvate formate-lyase-activating protein [Clostridium aestuarii]MCY6483105.1 pyruvate formate-lyase-activating protein [Clostridium aestuarii]
MTRGRIHSFESMGLVDGPGIRVVVFFQGCPLRCAYCHNPDTWNLNEGTEITAKDLLNKILRFKPYFKESGGVTFSGGEVLLQPDFLIAILKMCKENGIHTVIDTSGFGIGKYDEILKYTDLVLLDIKHVDDVGYKYLTGKDKLYLDQFLKTVDKSNTKLWIRHVVIPGITDSEEHIFKLGDIIKKIKNVEKIELLPYHTLGINKYENLGINYRLKEVPPMNKEQTKKLEKLLEKYIT